MAATVGERSLTMHAWKREVMQMRTRQEERMVTIALPEGGSLEGIFIAGAPGSSQGAVIAPPHPLYGGSIESPVLNEIAYACTKAGIANLRFNWRGVGASTGALGPRADGARSLSDPDPERARGSRHAQMAATPHRTPRGPGTAGATARCQRVQRRWGRSPLARRTRRR